MKKRKLIYVEDILADTQSEDDFLEVPLREHAFRFFYMCCGGTALIIIGVFLYIGIWKHPVFEARAIENISDIEITPAPRGVIKDAFGEAFVTNSSSFNAYLSPKYLPKDSNERQKNINNIAEELEISREEIQKKITEHDWQISDRILLAKDISHDMLVKISSKDIAGLEIDYGYKRVHEFPREFSHITGYVSLATKDDIKKNNNLSIDDEVGKGGLEEQYDSYLRGESGKKLVLKNAKGEVQNIQDLEAPKLGLELHTSIDKEFQDYFYKTLKAKLDELGRNSGVGIAMNPQNGEILALVSIPGFDISNIKESLQEIGNPFFNRAVSGVYNPGSTIKPLVATAALTEELITEATQIYSKGYIEIPNPFNPDNPGRFVEFNEKPHGWINVKDALAVSSNVFFYEVAGGFDTQRGLGILKLKEWWKKFGLEEKTGIDIPGEKVGFLPDPDWKKKKTGDIWRIGDTYNVSIGQGDFMVTPLELLNYISAIANDGTFWRPRVMKNITNEKGDVVLESKEEVIRTLDESAKSALRIVRQGMIDVTQKPYGSAYIMHDLPFVAAAKTGSAQVENNKKTNAFTVGYAPAENPQISFVVLVENARDGSLNTVPVAKDILMWYYKNRIYGNNIPN